MNAHEWTEPKKVRAVTNGPPPFSVPDSIQPHPSLPSIQRRSVWTIFPKKSEIISNCAVATVLRLYAFCCQHLICDYSSKIWISFECRVRTVYEQHTRWMRQKFNRSQDQNSWMGHFVHKPTFICIWRTDQLEIHKWCVGFFVCWLFLFLMANACMRFHLALAI